MELETSGTAVANARTTLSLQVTAMFGSKERADSPARERTRWRNCSGTSPSTRIDLKEWRNDIAETKWVWDKKRIKRKESFYWLRSCDCLGSRTAKSEHDPLRQFYFEWKFCNITVETNIGPIWTQKLYITNNKDNERIVKHID